MQNPGSLRKRRSRNLSKVNGVEFLNQDSNERDQLSFSTRWRRQSSKSGYGGDINSPYFSHTDTYFNSANSKHPRVTRDPKFAETGLLEYNTEASVDIDFPSVVNIGYPTSPEVGTENDFTVHDRPFLLSNSTIWKFCKILSLGRCVFLFPWSWNWTRKLGKGQGDNQQFEIRRWTPTFERLWLLFSVVTFTLSAILSCFHVYLLTESFKSANGHYRITFKSLEAICWHLHSAMLNIILNLNKENIRVYINTLFNLNRSLVSEFGLAINSHDKRSGGKLFLNITVPIFFAQVLVSITRYCNFYDAPIYLTSYFEKRDEIPTYVVVLGAIQDIMTSGQLVSGTLFLGWITVAHAVSIEFWLEEAHHNSDTERTKDSLREAKRAMEIFRTVQVMSKLFNQTVGCVSVPMCAFMNWSAAIACGYVAVRSLNQLFIDEFPASILYPFGITLTLCSAFAQFQMATVMHDMSTSFLDSWSYTRDKGFRRFLVSCPVVKVEALGVSSVTRESLVAYLKTVSDHIIDCIMTFP